MMLKSALSTLFHFLFISSFFGQTPGASYCGPYNSSSPISLSGQSNMTISNLEITNPNGNCIELRNCDNIIIERCLLRNSTGNGIDLFNCTNITIIDNRFDSVASGVYAYLSQGIKVSYNDSKNVLGPFPRGQLAQFNEVNGGGNFINYNVSENILGQSYPEDAINIYRSNGLANDPIQVYGNWIRGGGPSAAGSGIMLGDNGSTYTIAKDNILVDPGQVGIAIAGGHNNQLINNKVYGRSQSFTNVGLYVWNWSGNPPGTVCYDHTVMGNEVYWINAEGVANHRWDGDGNCGTITGWSNNTWGADLDDSILPTQLLADCSTGGPVDDFPVKSQITAEMGDITVENANYGVVLKAQNGTCFRFKVDNNGSLITEEVTCPE